ncbi:MAG: nucleotidyltransferase domain-containing protein [Candidatus Diapherotrites archaeon]
MSNIFDSCVTWKLLSYFLTEPWKESYVKELAKNMKISSGSVSVLCKKLCSENLLKKEIRGNLLLYKLNKNNPIMKELQKAYLLNRLTKAKFTQKFFDTDESIISLAIYGSYVSGDVDDKSDLDVLIITQSNANFSEAVRKIAKEIKIDVNINKFTLLQWKKLSGKNDPFYKEVISNHILLKGSSLVI